MENVMPAIQKTNEKTLRELAPEEFQHMLSTWFQERGLVQDMKSYLKFQMINVLRNTVVGKSIKRSASQTYTLAQQALHLIVAEYLLYHQCHFALSLFSTEVNLSSILPETKLFFDQETVCNGAPNKFDKENLINILELIGIPKESQCIVKIFKDYFESEGKPLLSCLLSLISKATVKLNTEEDYPIDVELDDDFMKNVRLTLQSLNLPPKIQTHLMHNLKVCYDLKTKSYESQVVQLVNKFKKELHYHEQKLHHNKRRARCLEKKLFKLKEENEILRSRNEKGSCVQSEKVIEKIISVPCSLYHCTEECAQHRRLCESYKKEIEKLKGLNLKQKEEIEKLSKNCKELIDEFNSCQSKINLVNTRLQSEIVYENQKGIDKEDIDNVSLSSDSITEEILQQARQKLKLLEEESEELDIRFRSLIVK